MGDVVLDGMCTVDACDMACRGPRCCKCRARPVIVRVAMDDVDRKTMELAAQDSRDLEYAPHACIGYGNRRDLPARAFLEKEVAWLCRNPHVMPALPEGRRQDQYVVLAAGKDVGRVGKKDLQLGHIQHGHAPRYGEAV